VKLEHGPGGMAGPVVFDPYSTWFN
jgi:hypothetical protein